MEAFRKRELNRAIRHFRFWLNSARAVPYGFTTISLHDTVPRRFRWSMTPHTPLQLAEDRVDYDPSAARTECNDRCPARGPASFRKRRSPTSSGPSAPSSGQKTARSLRAWPRRSACPGETPRRVSPSSRADSHSLRAPPGRHLAATAETSDSDTRRTGKLAAKPTAAAAAGPGCLWQWVRRSMSKVTARCRDPDV
jgi:hypothetical protein